MPEGHSQQFHTAFEALQQQGPLKTWSLIVTLFGDLALPESQALESTFLQRFCAPFGVKPEALRVALHRLRKDDWIKAQKHGRHMSYRLTELGEKATSEAYERIYRGPVSAPKSWGLGLVSDARTYRQEGCLPVSESILASLDTFAPDGGALSLDVGYEALPAWMKAALVDAEKAREFAQFEAVVDAISAPKDALAQLCLRVLIVHHWRRLLLRQSDLPELLLGPDWPGYGARLKTSALLLQLEKPDKAALDAFGNAQT